MAELLNRWSCHRLECLTEFLSGCFADVLLDVYAGPPSLACRESECTVESLEIRLIKKAKFSRIVLLYRNTEESRALEQATERLGACDSVKILTGSVFRDQVMRSIFDSMPRSCHGVALINPPGYALLRWSVIRNLAKHGIDWQGRKMDLCLVFPLEMSLLRNLLRPECRNSISRLYGGDEWQITRKKLAEHKITPAKARRELVDIFKSNLKKLGYKYVEDSEPARFTTPPYYHIIWASDASSQTKGLTSSWSRERYLACEMFRRGEPGNA
jgi:three-Cys-motif partner protein